MLTWNKFCVCTCEESDDVIHGIQHTTAFVQSWGNKSNNIVKNVVTMKMWYIMCIQ